MIEEKLCRLPSEFGRVCERRKLRVNVDSSKVMRCSMYLNMSRMNIGLDGETAAGSGLFQELGVSSGSRWRMWYRE